VSITKRWCEFFLAHLLLLENPSSLSLFSVPELCSSVTFPETMGFAKANELLLLGKRIDAKTAVDWNICSQVVPNTVDDPFDPNSLASHLCGQLEKQLISLPLSQKTATYFVALIRGSRKQRMQQVCRRELLKLDERGRTGQILEALQALKIGRSKL
jgi:enoyl-CoA hydratase/carnithine racemase